MSRLGSVTSFNSPFAKFNHFVQQALLSTQVTLIRHDGLQVQTSPQLRLLLHTVLQLGNTLNAGRRPPSSGIRLSSLRKLADTRSFDGSTTLVHYLVALLSQSAPEVRSKKI